MSALEQYVSLKLIFRDMKKWPWDLKVMYSATISEMIYLHFIFCKFKEKISQNSSNETE